MKLINVTGILFVAILATSCITKERCARFYPPQTVKSDSVSITVFEKETDTIFRVTADSSWLKALIECDKKGNATIKNLTDYSSGQRAGLPRINIHDNVLTADCKCDSIKIHALLKNRETTIDKRTDTTITPPAIEVKYIPGWMWFFGITGMIAWGIGALYAVFKFIKPRFI
ncbi:MAG: hypothetical protein NT004_02415 [Bacteroidetes bacterium]|nr:hypothetical protein [Bacteroidota bacterium]